MKLAFIIIGSALALFAGVLGVLYLAFEETKTNDETVSQQIDRVVIRAESGDIEIVRGDRSVEIHERRSYVLDSPEVSRSVDGRVLTLESECGGLTSMLCRTDYRVEVPKDVTVDVRTYVGDVEVDGIATKRIEARSYVGDVEIDAPRRTEVEARTNVGDVDVSVPRGTSHTVDAHSDVGAVDITAR